MCLKFKSLIPVGQLSAFTFKTGFLFYESDTNVGLFLILAVLNNCILTTDFFKTNDFSLDRVPLGSFQESRPTVSSYYDD
jgi:hypothetical protein